MAMKTKRRQLGLGVVDEDDGYEDDDLGREGNQGQEWQTKRNLVGEEDDDEDEGWEDDGYEDETWEDDDLVRQKAMIQTKRIQWVKRKLDNDVGGRETLEKKRATVEEHGYAGERDDGKRRLRKMGRRRKLGRWEAGDRRR